MGKTCPRVWRSAGAQPAPELAERPTAQAPTRPASPSTSNLPLIVAVVYAFGAAPFVIGGTFSIRSLRLKPFGFEVLDHHWGIMFAIFLLVLLAWLLFWRGARRSGLETALYWAGSSIAFLWLITVACVAYGWSWLGTDALGKINTGVFMGASVMIASGAFLIIQRTRDCGKAEAITYWLVTSCGIWLAMMAWTNGHSDSYIAPGTLAIALAAAIYFIRRRAPPLRAG